MASLFNPAGIVDFAEQTVRAYIKAASWGEVLVEQFARVPGRRRR
jgi:hypothetical protein